MATKIRDYKLRERYLAIVLLDLIGSTAFVQKVGAQRAARWLQYHDRLARSLCYKHQGREIDRSDGFLLSFESVEDAVNFSLKYQETIPPKVKIQCRIGIHWGLIVEVHQDELLVVAGAKKVELEGISKNIAARTMSLCQAGQVLLTKEAAHKILSRTKRVISAKYRMVCVGLYKFKGVKAPIEVFAVGESIKSLQPPPGSEKVKRLGGPKKIKQRARDRKVMDWALWFIWRAGLLATCFWIYAIGTVLLDPNSRLFYNLPYSIPFLDNLVEYFRNF